MYPCKLNLKSVEPHKLTVTNKKYTMMAFS